MRNMIRYNKLRYIQYYLLIRMYDVRIFTTPLSLSIELKLSWRSKHDTPLICSLYLSLSLQPVTVRISYAFLF